MAFKLKIMLYDEYAKTTQEYKSKYGPRTLVLIEVGSFFEMYAVKDSDSNEMNEEDMKNITFLLDIQMTRKNKSNLDINRLNPFMAGFPSFMLEKYIDILVSNGYTIVIMEQKKTKLQKSKNPTFYRCVTRVISPGTYIPECQGDTHVYKENITTRYTVSVVLSHGRINGKPIASYGLAVADFITGETYVYEYDPCNIDFDLKVMKEDMYRMLTVFKPVELIINGNLGGLERVDTLLEYLDMTHSISVHDKSSNNNLAPFDKLEYQNTMIRKVWHDKCKCILSPIEVINLERKQLAVISLCILLQFAYDHCEQLPMHLSIPQITHEISTNTLSMNYNSAMQLNLLPMTDSKEKCFLNLFNKCTTPMGRRAFRMHLLTPTNNTIVLNHRFSRIEACIKDNKYMQICDELKGISDIPRLLRKMVLRSISFNDIWNLTNSIEKACHILKSYETVINQETNNMMYTDIDLGTNFVQYVKSIFNDPDSKLYNQYQAMFNPDIDRDYKDTLEMLDAHKNRLTSMLVMLNHGTDGYYKLENNEKEGYFLAITQRRHKEMLEIKSGKYIEVDGLDSFSYHDLETIGSASNSTVRLTCKAIKQINKDITTANDVIAAKNKEYLEEQISKFMNDYDMFQRISQYIGDVDVAANNAMLARKNCWVKPVLENGQKSFINAKGLRHPIVEAITQDHTYVPNDIYLGKDNMDGMLLYGINASGKSSLMKSVGLAIIMSQAGMFVACDSLTMRPYTSIFTRITSGDNIYTGKSTFTNEILELRNILKMVDKDSLVIGDELCSGTESLSAIALVGAGIERLSTAQCTFLFATHLHELTKLDIISHLANVNVYHLDIKYDSVKETIIYDRKLKPGPGDALYGLEVCKCLDLDDAFMRMATNIRKKILNMGQELVSTKKSRYNKRIYMDVCELCRNEMSSETHHILPQHLADETGVIPGKYHKNKKHNLISLCSKCHDKIHESNVYGTKLMTSHGPMLINTSTMQSDTDCFS